MGKGDEMAQDKIDRGGEMEGLRNDKKGKRGVGRILEAYRYSKAGIGAAWRDEEAFRIVFVLGIFFGILGLFVGETWAEKILLVLPCVLCITGELINSAIENAIDFASLEIHPLAKKAKDMGSAVQFVLLLFFLIVWGSYPFFKLL